MFDYTSYYETRLQQWALIPYFLRIFEGRWYLIAEYLNHEKTKMFVLERIFGLRLRERMVRAQATTDAATYYASGYGIIPRNKQTTTHPPEGRRSNAVTCEHNRYMNRMKVMLIDSNNRIDAEDRADMLRLEQSSKLFPRIYADSWHPLSTFKPTPRPLVIF